MWQWRADYPWFETLADSTSGWNIEVKFESQGARNQQHNSRTQQSDITCCVQCNTGTADSAKETFHLTTHRRVPHISLAAPALPDQQAVSWSDYIAWACWNRLNEAIKRSGAVRRLTSRAFVVVVVRFLPIAEQDRRRAQRALSSWRLDDDRRRPNCAVAAVASGNRFETEAGARRTRTSRPP